MKRIVIFTRTIWVSGLIMMLVVGCQNVGADVSGTLAAGDMILATEESRMFAAAQQDQINAAGTLAVAQTEIASQYSVNDQLFATVAAGSTPTVALIVGQASLNQAEMMLDGERLFTQTGVSTTVNDSNGCVVDPRGAFERDNISVIYATAQVVNASENLNLRADWFFEGELITQTYWMVDPVNSPTCFWASIDRADTDFPPGNYTVQMYLDTFPLRDLTMAFLINANE